MKIHIIGGSGTGKTYLAKKISDLYKIPHYDLDDIFWDNTSAAYGVKMPFDKRDKLLKEILLKDNWVIEGVYFDWVIDSFEVADFIFLMNVSRKNYYYRIIRRYIYRKLGLEKGKKETLKSLINLLKWTNHYQDEKLPKIKVKLEDYSDKTYYVDSADSAIRIVNEGGGK